MSSLPRIILEYEGMDAFILPKGIERIASDGRIYRLHSLASLEPISPNAAQKFIRDLEENKINFKELQFKVITSYGSVIGFLEHDLEQK